MDQLTVPSVFRPVERRRTFREPALTRLALLKLSRDICRVFLNEYRAQEALEACADAVARACCASNVSIAITSDEGTPLIVSHRIPDPAGSETPGGRSPSLECTVPIFGDDIPLGTLTITSAPTASDDLKPFLEEAAVELGRCLSGSRARTSARARVGRGSALTNATLVGVACLDGELRVIGWNAGCRELMGWTAEDVLGKDLTAVFGPTASSLLDGSVRIAMDGRRASANSIPLRRWDGREFPSHVEALPGFDGAENSVAVRLIIRDDSATEKSHRLVALSAAVSQLVEGYSSIEDVAGPVLREICAATGWLRGELWRAEPSTNEWQQVGEWNADELAAPAQGMTLRLGLDCGIVQAVSAERQLVRLEDFAANSRRPAVDSAERLGLQEAVGVPIFVDGNVFAAIACLADEIPPPEPDLSNVLASVASQLATLIKKARFESGLREAQQNLTQSKKMEAIGLLAGGVAHDFNNLLTIILGSTEIAAEMLGAESPAAGFLSEIERAGRRAAELTRQLLTFSRKQPMRCVSLDVNSRIRDAEKILRRLVNDRIELEIQTRERVHPIKCDPTQFDQVLFNFIANARDAVSADGRIVVSTRSESLSVAAARRYAGGRPGEFVVVAVSDNGCGMDAKTVDRIFEPFFTTKDRGKGTGMGLATVHGVVTQCGGFLTIESAPGRGTTMSAFFPRTDELPRTMQVNSQPEASATGTESILLVEDEDVLRTLAAQMLAVRGYTVRQAAGAAEALQLLKQEYRFDLLVTDVMMPGMTGPELVSQVRSAGNPLPVLYMSGYVDECARGEQSWLLDSALLHKPFTSLELVAAVRRILDGRELAVTRDELHERKLVSDG